MLRLLTAAYVAQLGSAGLARHVGFWAKSGKHLLVVSFTGLCPKAAVRRAEISHCGEPLTDPHETVMVPFWLGAGRCNSIT